jgi:dimethylamine--corrinoid protein Co-methyltransferase
MKECVKEAGKIAVHINVGMGVGGIPMCETIPHDVVSRADKALIEICKIDGLQIGEGDAMGTEITHTVSACMGGMKTAGDLVLRMQLMYGMRLREAKEYVAEKLGVSVFDLSDPSVMTEIRQSLGLGVQEPNLGDAVGMAAKIRIAEKLGITINSVENFKRKAGL